MNVKQNVSTDFLFSRRQWKNLTQLNFLRITLPYLIFWYHKHAIFRSFNFCPHCFVAFLKHLVSNLLKSEYNLLIFTIRL